MEFKLLSMERIRRGYEEDAPGPAPAVYRLSFALRGCAAPIEDVIDALESLDDILLERCTAADGQYSVSVEVTAADWRPAARVLAAAVNRLPATPTAPNPLDPVEFDLLELDIGVLLVPHVQDVISGIDLARRRIVQELGFVFAPVRIRDSPRLSPDQYEIRVRGNQVVTAAVDQSVPDPASPVLHALDIAIKSNADILLTRQDVYDLITRLRRRVPALVQDCIPGRLSVPKLHGVLRTLLKQQQSIRDMERILEVVSDHADTDDNETLARFVVQKQGC